MLNTHSIDCYCTINGINKSEAVNLLQNSDLSQESRSGSL